MLAKCLRAIRCSAQMGEVAPPILGQGTVPMASQHMRHLEESVENRRTSADEWKRWRFDYTAKSYVALNYLGGGAVEHHKKAIATKF